ncbi:GGDEF domain-containing protein [Acinetobacter portensis]|uniref:GGDEF domain-containing protein n=1 Tax=Acinetobacter portensis TaxID=1839785 RepID=UPI0030C7F553
MGDEAIQAVADVLRLTIRKTDCACRLGGDEFVVILPNTGYEQAIQLAKRIHDRTRKELSQFSVDDELVTASIGVTTILPEDRSYKDTLKRADIALYEAKNKGKDRIVAA